MSLVYIVRDAAGVVTYVGWSDRAWPARWNDHRKSKSPCLATAVDVEVIDQPDAESAQALEVELIKEHRPRFNVQHTGRVVPRPRWVVRDDSWGSWVESEDGRYVLHPATGETIDRRTFRPARSYSGP